MDTIASLYPAYHAERAMTLALRLAHAENALHALTLGQVDAIIDSDGKPYLLRPAQEHIRQSQKRFQNVMESMADSITVLDRAGRIISQTKALNQLLGYEPGWLLERQFFDFVHPDDLPKLHSAFLTVVEQFQPDAFVEFRHQHRDGSYLVLETMVTRLREGSVNYVVLVSRDANRRQSLFLSAAAELAGGNALSAALPAHKSSPAHHITPP